MLSKSWEEEGKPKPEKIIDDGGELGSK